MGNIPIGTPIGHWRIQEGGGGQQGQSDHLRAKMWFSPYLEKQKPRFQALFLNGGAPANHILARKYLTGPVVPPPLWIRHSPVL